MSKASKEMIRIIVFKDGGSWVAQCLEHDICAQADDLEALRSRIDATIDAEYSFSVGQKKKPFEGIPPAPKHYHEMWERRSSFTSPDPSPDEESQVEVEFALCA